MKKNKTIWLNIFGKGFLGLSLFLLCLGFIGISSASAETTVTNLSIDGNNNVTIPTGGENTVLVCNMEGTVAYNGTTMTKITTTKVGWGDTDIFYLVAPETGTHQLTGITTEFIGNMRQCYLLTGINQTNPLVSYSAPLSEYKGCSYTKSYYDALENNLLVITQSGMGYSYGGNLSAVCSSGTSLINNTFSISGYEMTYWSFYKTASGSGTDNFDIALTNRCDNNVATHGHIVEWNTSLAPPSNNYIQYLGQPDQSIGTIGNNAYYPYIFNYCDSFDSNNEYIMVYMVDGIEVARQQVSSSICSSAYFQPSTFTGTLMTSASGVSTLSLYSVPYEFGVVAENLPLEDLTLVVSSNEFNSIIGDGVETFFAIYQGNGIIPNDGIATTTNIRVAYNYCNLTDKNDITKICTANSTECYTPTECRGDGIVTIPVEELGDWNNYNYLLENASSTVLYTGEQFSLAFSASGGANTLPESSDVSLYGTTSRLMACTEEEWATTDNTFGFNITKTKCIAMTAVYTGVRNISNVITKIFNIIITQISGIFPINIPVSISHSWKASETATLPNDLAFLNMTNEDGSLSASYPKEWLGTTTDKTITIFSKEMITSGSTKAEDYFANFKNFTKYLQWFIFIGGILFLAKKVLEDISVTNETNSTQNFHENSGKSVNTNNKNDRINTTRSTSNSTSNHTKKHKKIKY